MSYSTTTSADGYFITLICPRCGGNHYLEKCPQVKAIEYHENGSIKHVEFIEPLPPVSSASVTTPSLPDWNINLTYLVDWNETARLMAGRE